MNGLRDPIPQLEHLSDRELLVLAVREINALKIELIVQHSRLRSLEIWRYMISGGLVVVVGMGTYILSRLP